LRIVAGVDDLPALMPSATGERLLECIIRGTVDETMYRIEVRRVTSPSDVGLVGCDVVLSLRLGTEIRWVGDDTMREGTVLLVPVESGEPLDRDVVLTPSEITLQNGRGEMF
jgi:hypothetical protein